MNYAQVTTLFGSDTNDVVRAAWDEVTGHAGAWLEAHDEHPDRKAAQRLAMAQWLFVTGRLNEWLIGDERP